jgi:hypothetical protein
MSFAEAWDTKLPLLASAVVPSEARAGNCGACDLRPDCKWCPVYAYLECRDHAAKIDDLCAIARETRRVREGRLRSHRRRFRIAGLTVDVEAVVLPCMRRRPLRQLRKPDSARLPDGFLGRRPDERVGVLLQHDE